MSTTIIDHTAENKKRSYRNRVKAGDRVEFLTNVDRKPVGRVRAGHQGTVVSENNAGFRGIEAQIRLDGSGALVSHVSTGILRKMP